MAISGSQRQTLRAIVDTFAPATELGEERVPAGSEAGALEAIEEAVASAPRTFDRQQFGLVLSALGGRAATAIAGGGFRRFAALDQQQRERVLLSWADSPLPQRRAVFQALRKAALTMTYLAPGASGQNPRWDVIGYPGPPMDAPKQPHPLRTLPVDGDTDLSCDVVVVGSGAGGGTAAGVLTAAGLDVILVEAGGYFAESDFNGAELEGLKNLYLGAGGIGSDDNSIGLLAGSCLGGGTVINYTTSFRTPDEVRQEWAGLGSAGHASPDYAAAMDAVCERLGVNYEHSAPGSRDALMKSGLDALGWHADFMPRNVRGCNQGERCGFCGYGCPLGAKQSTLKTWINDAAEAGARLLVDTFVTRVMIKRGAAQGIEGQHRASGSRIRVRARAVVSAAGALHTPALLRRSGLRNSAIGSNLRLHPATAVWGVVDERLDPWNGTLQAVYSDQHRDLDGQGYGLKYETAPVQPSILVGFGPWRSGRQHLEMMREISHTAVIGVLLRDKGSGEVRTARDGMPVVRYHLSDEDIAHARVGIEGAAKILEAAGAQRIFTSHSKMVDTHGPVRVEELMRRADAAGFGPAQVGWYSFHIMGSARMGSHPTSSATDPTGQTWEARDLVVCDGSAFPTSSGVNPMISIESTAYMNAQALATRLT
ncbi:MAG: GMC family oxidoreductase N-terminal domain-containing protein [Solirubrobacteraceae bacterium]|nr:MAG: oxidoreductase [Solirubrobacterales bacterium]